MLKDMSMRCVIVDDSPSLLVAARTLLEREGIAVVGVASTANEAVRVVEELRPDLALIDIDLGADSGFDVARRLANGTRQQRPMSILISTHAQDDFADLIQASPAIGFLSKSDLSAKAIHAIVDASPES